MVVLNGIQGDMDPTHRKSLKERQDTNMDVNICKGRSGESTRQSHQDPSSTCHPPKDKKEGKAKPAQAERLH